MNPFSLEGKTILVTGASSGIGKASSIFLSEMGARVILVGRNKESLYNTLLDMNSEKQDHIISCYDMSDIEGIQDWLKSLVKEKSIKLDGLVHSAGIHDLTPLRSVNSKRVKEIIEINVLSSIQLLSTFTKKTITNSNSSIILFSSASAVNGEPGVIGYAASKGAINSIVKSGAVELAKRDIRVNSLVPGVVKTKMGNEILEKVGEKQFKEIEEKHLLGLGDPKDIAYSVGFLLSDAARWITGSALTIDGGYTCH